MIWVLSTYYCTDSTMVPLLERIAVTLVEKVRNTLIPETLFRYHRTSFNVSYVRVCYFKETCIGGNTNN